jgi:DNA-binding IclR family transcriptional regulator
LRTVLARVRQHGCAVVHEEFEEGFSGIAAPIFDHAGQVVASLSVSGPTYRLEPGVIEGFLGPLRETARCISIEMGFC